MPGASGYITTLERRCKDLLQDRERLSNQVASLRKAMKEKDDMQNAAEAASGVTTEKCPGCGGFKIVILDGRLCGCPLRVEFSDVRLGVYDSDLPPTSV